ncbi:membrane protein [Mycolicibacterium chitae]|uniref:Protein-disulfide isomerase n=1 Tax=Mycolicibacterium chitae TaxID=1792 RepID=A0A448I8M0_MYCCI|nr:thioredoxin domain-containing protein [Mycolicibacterium chitae]MCV7108847.1 thioredoxin domain-containing protein [Mycolicibacterium chitae]BBZ05129.1 membrane protein [Mycolicibacterium chitae]VEG48750.1 protein-disulfide isomerase [Mycolicibacterium chitae]
MAKASKRPAKYDLKAADRKRNLAVQIGLTAIVVVFAVGLVFYIVSNGSKGQTGEAQAVRVESTSVIKEEGSDQPKAVISVYEDFLCPHCAQFEAAFGPTLNRLIDSGAVAVDYYMLGFMDSAASQDGSTRAANAGYCVAEADTTPAKEAFRRFHTALFMQQQPSGTPDSGLIETARQAGVADGVAECVNGGNFVDMIGGLPEATGVTATPTIRINGEDYQQSTPDALVAKITEIVGEIPNVPAPAPAPEPAPAPAP